MIFYFIIQQKKESESEQTYTYAWHCENENGQAVCAIMSQVTFGSIRVLYPWMDGIAAFVQPYASLSYHSIIPTAKCSPCFVSLVTMPASTGTRLPLFPLHTYKRQSVKHGCVENINPCPLYWSSLQLDSIFNKLFVPPEKTFHWCTNMPKALLAKQLKNH